MHRQLRAAAWVVTLAVGAAACAEPASSDQSSESQTSSESNSKVVAPSLDAASAVSPDAPRAHRAPEQPVSVEWVDDVDRTLLVADEALHARVTNKTKEPLKVNLAAVGDDTTTARAAYVVQLELAPGERRDVEVELAKIPVQTTSSAAPLRLMAVLPELDRQVPSPDLAVSFDEDFEVAFVSARNALGPSLAAKLHGNVADARILELAADRNALVRPEELSTRADTALVPQGRVLTDLGFAPIQAVAPKPGLVTLGAPLSAVSTLSPSGTIKIPPGILNVNVHLCARWSVTYSDSSFYGEDELNEGHFTQVGSGDFKFWLYVYDPVPARFARVWVTNKTTGVSAYTGPLDAQGCVELWVPAGTYTLTVDTYLKKGDTRYDVHELTYKGIDYHCPTTHMRGYDECDMQGWFSREFSVSRPANGWETVNATVDSGYASSAFRVAGVAGLMLLKDDGGMVAGRDYVAYANSGCSSFGWKEACADSSAYYGMSIGDNPTDTTLSKFTVSHELGHQLEWQRGATKYYTYPVPVGTPDLCSCAHVTHGNNWHCLQSRHDYSTAHTEGFAQFVSARTMNDSAETDCTFAYYKDVKFADGTVSAPPVRVDCGTPARWVATYCPATGTSSEWDLMDYYRALTSGGADAMTMNELLQTLAGANYSLTWPSFRDSAASVLGASSPKYTRLVSLASTYGVNL